MVKIAVVGCVHGQLDRIYEDINLLEAETSTKVDIVLICGDFQAIRSKRDLSSIAVPQKYIKFDDFWKYYAGVKTAPYTTLVIGGNHESSNYTSELPYGGWMAKNIYYMGRSNVLNYRGLRIAGISGIYKSRDYSLGYYECPPFDEESMRSVYHTRNLDVFRLAQLRYSEKSVDIFLSHDWPKGIEMCTSDESIKALKEEKPFLVNDIEKNELGNPAIANLLCDVMPKYWFAAHLHVKFTGMVVHDDDKATKFLALSKPQDDFSHVQILDIAPDVPDDHIGLQYDREWLGILSLTDPLLSIDRSTNYLKKMCAESSDYFPKSELLAKLDIEFAENFDIPAYEDVFEWTESPLLPAANDTKDEDKQNQYVPYINNQTVKFQQLLNVRDPVELVCAKKEIKRISVEEAKSICADHFDALIMESNSVDIQPPNEALSHLTLEGQMESKDLECASSSNGYESREDGEID